MNNTQNQTAIEFLTEACREYNEDKTPAQNAAFILANGGVATGALIDFIYNGDLSTFFESHSEAILDHADELDLDAATWRQIANESLEYGGHATLVHLFVDYQLSLIADGEDA